MSKGQKLLAALAAALYVALNLVLLDQRFTSLEKRAADLEMRVSAVEEVNSRLEERLSAVEAKSEALDTQLAAEQSRLNNLQEDVRKLTAKVEARLGELEDRADRPGVTRSDSFATAGEIWALADWIDQLAAWVNGSYRLEWWPPVGEDLYFAPDPDPILLFDVVGQMSVSVGSPTVIYMFSDTGNEGRMEDVVVVDQFDLTPYAQRGDWVVATWQKELTEKDLDVPCRISEGLGCAVYWNKETGMTVFVRPLVGMSPFGEQIRP